MRVNYFSITIKTFLAALFLLFTAIGAVTDFYLWWVTK